MNAVNLPSASALKGHQICPIWSVTLDPIIHSSNLRATLDTKGDNGTTVAIIKMSKCPVIHPMIKWFLAKDL